MIYRNEAFSLSDLLKEMFFINWVNLDHWWFMNMIVIAYLLLPIAANIIKHCNKKFLKAIFIFYCIYTGLYKIIDDILLAFGKKDLPDSISLGYTYGIFVIYLVMGYLIKKGILKKLSTITLTYIAILFFGIIFIFQVLAYSIGNGFNVWYDCPVLWISTVAIFELLSRVKTIKCYKLVQNISHYSFAIYFVHIIIRELLFKFIPSTTVWLPLYVILLTIVLFITTWFIVIIIDKIPKVGKILFNIK